MPETRFKARSFRTFFYTYLVLFLVLAIAALGSSIGVLRNERKAQKQATFEERAQKVNLLIDGQLDSVNNVMNILWNTSWITKMMTADDWLEAGFDILRQSEISQSIHSITAANQMISDVTIVYPQKNLAINSSGWWNLDEYARYLSRQMGASEDETKDILTKLPGTDGILSQNFRYAGGGTILITQQLDFTANPRALAVIMLSKGQLNRILQPFLDEQLLSVELYDQRVGSVLVCGAPSKSNTVVIKQSGSFALETRVGYLNDQWMLTTSDLTVFLAAFFVSLLAAGIISYRLAAVSYAPLGRLLARLISSGEHVECREKNEYILIEQSFQKLYDENRDFEKNLGEYKEAAKKTICLRLLKGYFQAERFGDELSRYGIPFTEQQEFAVLLFSWTQWNVSDYSESPYNIMAKSMAVAEYEIRRHKYQAAVVDTMDDSFAVVLSFTKESKSVSEISDQISNEVYGLIGMLPDTAESTFHKGIIGISIAYQEAKSKQEKKPKSGNGTDGTEKEIRFYYPADWERQLFSSICNCDESLAYSIFDQIKKSNEDFPLSDAATPQLLRLIATTVTQAAGETIRSSEHLLLAEAAQKCDWKSMRSAVGEICRKISGEKLGMIHTADNDLLKYVNQNYCDPELSLKKVSQEFNISVASASRLFKEAASINFHEYVTRLRINKAKRLLSEYGYDLKRIVLEIGYDSEYSFKRAFFRVEGKRPKDFLEKTDGVAGSLKKDDDVE